MTSSNVSDLTEHQQKIVIDDIDKRIEEQDKDNQGRKRPQEILDFVRVKIRKHFEGIKHHAEKLEIYQFIAEDLELVHCRYTPEGSVASDGELGTAPTTTTRATTLRARCRFAPDSEEEDEEDSNAERIRKLGEKFAAAKQEDDSDCDWINTKLPAKTTKQTAKKAQIAEEHAKAREWASQRPPNPKVHSSPANLKAVQERKQAGKQKKSGKSSWGIHSPRAPTRR
jgi:hypothetical protein